MRTRRERTVPTFADVVDETFRWIIITSAAVWSWLGMMVLHETGHVLGASVSGGTVQKVVLEFIGFSRTDLADNPRPLLVAWAGPILGCILPLLLWGILHLCKLRLRYLFRFFAGVCCVANGAYIGAGLFLRAGDTRTLLQHGASKWQLGLFGIVAIAVGLSLWHRQGRHFDVGPHTESMQRSDALVSLGMVAVIFMVYIFVASR